MSSSKLGQPQCDSNFDSDVYKGVSHLLHTYMPFSLLFNSEPVNGRSVPLYNITRSSSGVSLLYSIVFDFTDDVLISPIYYLFLI
jgi:hypothetical protein